MTAILTEDAATGNAGSLTFTHTPIGAAAREIDIDLSNVTDEDSLASALNAALGGIGV